MMISKEEGAAELRKQQEEISTSSAAGKTTARTSSCWTRLKDPRIVRVSRALGGKDRHSKVCTVKGLRDRRVRLSVPTAIQLYDLQDRLGLNQPSKVVDWLLEAAKNEIDELPPLQFPPGTNVFPMIDLCKNMQGATNSINWNNIINQPSAPLDAKLCKDHHQGITNIDHRRDHCNWANQQEYSTSYANSSSSSSYNNNNSFARWDPSNLSLSHQPSTTHGLTHQHDDWPNFNLMVPLQPHHQVLVYQHGMSSTSTQSYFPNSQIGGSNIAAEIEANTTTSPPSERQIHFNMMTANLLPSQDDDDKS